MNNKNSDVRLFIWLIPVINVLTYYLTYTNFGPAWKIALTFSIDTLEGYAAWFVVRLIIKWLDKKISYELHPLKRILTQLMLTLLGGCLTIILLTEFVNWLAATEPVPASFYTTDIFIISIWFFVVNGIYTGMYYYDLWQQSEQTRKKEAEVKSSGFTVSSQKKDLLLQFQDIIGFYIDGDYSVVVTAEKRKFFLDTSLDRVEQTLPSPYFFRLNRQCIVHRQLVTGYERVENGKLNVLLKPTSHLPASVQVSRIKAPNFKAWFMPS